MRVSDLKRRWVLSKINPILFYVPLGNKAEAPKDKAHIVISPRTQIEMRTFNPYPSIPDKSVPFYSFYPKKEDTIATGSLKKYKAFLDLGEEKKNLIPTYGCCYRIYKKEYNKETQEMAYISVMSNGDLDLEDSFDSLHFNEKNFYLPEGEYYYYEEVSSEGDMIFFDTLKILIFKKDENYHENSSIIKDYSEEETPQDPEMLYIQYKSLDDNLWHETFNGYKGYIYKERSSNSSLALEDSEQKKSEFKYFIYHKPKTIKTYTRFKEVQETFESATKNGVERYGEWAIWTLWKVGPMGKNGDTSQGISPSDTIVSNYMYRIVPEVYKVKVMDKEVSAMSEIDIQRTGSQTYNWILSFIYNSWTATAGMFDTVGYCLQRYDITFPSKESYKAILLCGVPVSQSYIMSYSQYQLSGFSHSYQDQYGHLYTSISPKGTSGSDTSNLQEPKYNVGVGVAVLRGGEARGEGEKVNVFGRTENTLGPNVITKTSQLNGTIYNVEAKTGVHTSHITWHDRYGNSDDYTVTVEPKDTAISYASAEDCAYFAMRAAKAISAQYDTDNPGGYCAYMCDTNASHCFYDITCWEDNNENPVIVDTQVYNIDTAYFPSKPLYERKNGEDHVYWRWDQVKDLKEGCGASVLFTRQTRSFYKQWTGKQDSFEVKDTYTYKGRQIPYTVNTGEEQEEGKK